MSGSRRGALRLVEANLEKWRKIVKSAKIEPTKWPMRGRPIEALSIRTGSDFSAGNAQRR
jgi:hypothetical protein